MTVKELIEQLNRLNQDIDVVIGVEGRNIGTSPYVKVIGAYQGFDWDEGLCWICTKEKLKIRRNSPMEHNLINFKKEK
jgi:hypothetical protein